MTEPLFLATTILSQTSETAAKISAPANMNLQQAQRIQAEKARLDRLLFQLRKNTQPDTGNSTAEFSSTSINRPRSGSQLFAQRMTALKVGSIFTQLPASSYQSIWASFTQQPTYQQWRSLLAQEARQITPRSQTLGVLLGDSLSLWFPSGQLPSTRLWLNQSISGDTTGGILRRLNTFVSVRPQIIYVMAGINDLKQGATDATIVRNLQQIVLRLRHTHPHTQIVLQSILPARSLPISSQRIVNLNDQLQAIAHQTGAYYLDVYSQMVDKDGYLRPDLTTDGLHLTIKGYEVWQAVLHQAETQIAERNSGKTVESRQSLL